MLKSIGYHKFAKMGFKILEIVVAMGVLIFIQTLTQQLVFWPYPMHFNTFYQIVDQMGFAFVTRKFWIMR